MGMKVMIMERVIYPSYILLVMRCFILYLHLIEHSSHKHDCCDETYFVEIHNCFLGVAALFFELEVESLLFVTGGFKRLPFVITELDFVFAVFL